MDPVIDLTTTVSQAFAAGAAKAPTPGAAPESLLYEDLPADVYHADRDALSCSMLKPLLVSPAHFQASLATLDKDTRAKDFGTLLHTLVLQPHLVRREVSVYPGVVFGRHKAFDSFQSERPDRLCVDEPTFARARRLADKVLATTFKGRPLSRFLEEAIPEASVYFVEPTTGLRMRIRMDLYHPDVTFDLKSTRHGTKRLFARDAVDLDYDLQAFMYSLGRCLFEGQETPKPFVFLAAETEEPNSVFLLTAGESLLTNGSAKFAACVSAFKACTATGYWPDLGCEDTLDIEPWQQFSGKGGWRDALAATSPALH